MTKHPSGASFFFDRVVLGHPKTVILFVLIAVSFLMYQAQNFRLDASAETLVLENDEDLRYSRLIRSRYGEQDYLILTYTPKDDLLSDETLARIGRLRRDLELLENVKSVLTILDVPLLESPPIPFKELSGDLPTLESPTVDRELARTELQ